MASIDFQDRLRPMAAADLASVLAWRNSTSVRKYMFSQHEITAAEHARWFTQCLESGSKDLLIFESRGDATGFMSFSAPDGGRISEWGFYLGPHAPRGSGARMGVLALRYGFNVLKLHKVIGRTIRDNERSIQLHNRLGFHEEGLQREHHYDGENYCDVVLFGLLASEWPRNAK